MAVAHALAEAGKHILWPLSASQRYDLVFEDEDGFNRVQVKAGRVVDSAVVFMTCSRTANVSKDYRDQADFFGVYCQARDEVYLVPVGAVPTRAGYLRPAAPRNGQRKGIRWAHDYLLGEEPAVYAA